MNVFQPLNRFNSQRPQFFREFDANPLPTLGLSRTQQQEYSIRKAILASVTGNWNDAGFEREISNEIAARSNRSTGGAFVPISDLLIPLENRSTYAVGASATGGATVQTSVSTDYISFLRNKALIMLMGARMLSDLNGNLNIPRQSGIAVTYWVGEGGAVSQSESTFDDVRLRPKTVGNISRYTRSFLLQTSLDVEGFIRQDLASGIALEIDRAAINGSGSSNQPLGILNYPSAQVVSLGTNGGAPNYDSIIQMETLASTINADVGALGFLTTPNARGKLKRTLKNPTAANSDWIWENASNYDDQIGNGLLNGYRAGVSNQVPSNLTKGTGTNLSAIIFGNFNELLIGSWGELEILANPYGDGYDSGDVKVRALQTVDIQARHENSFCVIKDAITN
jgi:HK97 family phage major capsid protein